MHRLWILSAAWIVALCATGCVNSHRDAPPITASATTAASQPATAPLNVKVGGLRNKNGALLFAVYKSADGFPSEVARAVAQQTKTIDSDSVTFTVALPPGTYAVSVLHDENNNKKMDRSALGVPLEGYGTSNNPKPRFRAARFDESKFDLSADGANLAISMQYF